MQSKTRPAQSFLHGAAILTAGAMLVKILGAIYKIPLTNMIGEQGMGYFNTAYQLYLPIYTVASAGFPAAIARLVAERAARNDFAGARLVYRRSLPFFWISGAVGMALMIAGAPAYAAFVGSPDAAWSIRVLAPTVLVCCVMSALRGYYSGIRNMTPVALSQVLEAAGRLFIGLSAAYGALTRCRAEYLRSGTVLGQTVSSEAEALRRAIPVASAGAILGVTVGALLGWIALLCCDRSAPSSGTSAAGAAPTMRRIAALALPVCAGALVLNIGAMLDAVLLQRRLAAIPESVLRALFPGRFNGQDGAISTFLYGSYTMAQNLAVLVPTLAQSIAASALPTVAAAAAGGRPGALRDAVESVLRLTALAAFPAGFGLCALAGPILRLLYAARPNGAAIAAPPLMLLSLASIFMTFSAPVNSILQALGRERVPVRLLGAGCAIKLAVSWFLIVLPQYNLLGAAIGTLSCYAFAASVGLLCVRRSCPERPRILHCLLRPMAAGLLCAAAGAAAERLLRLHCGDSLATVAAILIAAAVYVWSVLLGRVLLRSDVESLPNGKKIANFLAKHHCLR